MKQSELRLVRYFYTRININAKPEHKPEKDKGFAVDISSNITKIPTEDNRYQLELNIKLGENETKNSPYIGNIQVIGVFSISDEIDNADIASLLHIDGGEMLYSSARDFVLSVTCRGPWSAITLPPIGKPDDKDIQKMRESAEKLV